MESLVGRTLQNGKYLIDRELGHGGFGITYKAIDLVTNEPVVIKTLKRGAADNPHREKLRKQFLEEARRLFQCEHSNIVRYRYFFEEKEHPGEMGQPFIVMDYIPGSTLDEIVIPDKPLPEATAIAYIQQVAEALKVVHSNGLLHRDVKPQNLILHQETGQVILIDFGISREFSQGETMTHTNLISEGYAPIEQYLPKAKRTAATDVYGLAATLYTLLTAQIPIAPTLRDRITLESPRDLRKDISSGVSQVVMKGMELEAKQRPATVDKWLEMLLEPSKHSIVLATRSNKPRATQKDIRGNLPLTAKEGGFGSFTVKRGVPVTVKAVVAASVLGLGMGYVGDKLGLMSLWEKNLPFYPQESIDRSEEQKNSDSNEGSNNIKEVEKQTERRQQAVAAEKDRVEAENAAEAERKAKELAKQQAEKEAIERHKQDAARREAEQKAAAQRAAADRQAKMEAEREARIEKQREIERQRQQEAARIAAEQQRQRDREAAAARRAAEHQRQLRIEAQAAARQKWDSDWEDGEDGEDGYYNKGGWKGEEEDED